MLTLSEAYRIAHTGGRAALAAAILEVLEVLELLRRTGYQESEELQRAFTELIKEKAQ